MSGSSKRTYRIPALRHPSSTCSTAFCPSLVAATAPYPNPLGQAEFSKRGCRDPARKAQSGNETARGARSFSRMDARTHRVNRLPDGEVDAHYSLSLSRVGVARNGNVEA